MKSTAFAIAILLSGAAVAQTTTNDDVSAETNVSVGTTTTGTMQTNTNATMHSGHTMGSSGTMGHSTSHASTGMTMQPASGAVVQPGNSNPEHDARGIAVISDPAMVPGGWNGTSGTGLGGPLVDTATGATVDAANHSYPACSRTVTDNCLQAYERGRSGR